MLDPLITSKLGIASVKIHLEVCQSMVLAHPSRLITLSTSANPQRFILTKSIVLPIYALPVHITRSSVHPTWSEVVVRPDPPVSATQGATHPATD